jgi:hypothetical protein
MDVDLLIRSELFMDLLVCIVGVAVVAALVIYGVIYKSLMKSVTLAAKAEMNKAIVSLLLAIGYNYWEEYVHTTNNWTLGQAIKITERSLQHYASELDEKERDSEWLICKLKNNLAYFYAEKQQKRGTATPDEKDSAQIYIKYIYDRIDKCPKDNQERETWLDTRKFVQQQFP